MWNLKKENKTMAKLNFENLEVDGSKNYKCIKINKIYSDDNNKTFKLSVNVNKWHPSYFKLIFDTVLKEIRNYDIPMLLRPFYFIKALCISYYIGFTK